MTPVTTTVADTAQIAVKKDSTEKKDEKLHVIILSMQGDTIRRYKTKLEDGFNRMLWDMRRDGVRSPSRQDPDKDADAPSGREVLPGTYTLVLKYGSDKDSTTIVVRRDPRLNLSEDKLKARDMALAEYESVVKASHEAFEQLKNAKKSVELVDKAIVNAPDSTQKKVKDLGKDVMKKIDELMAIYMHPEDAKGYSYEEDKLQSIIGEANYYLSNAPGNPGQNAQNASAFALSNLQKALEKINRFIDDDWKTYMESIMQVEFDLFKDVEKVQLK